MEDIPLTDVEITLKQVETDSLEGDTYEAIKSAFSGYYEPVAAATQEQIRAQEARLRQYVGKGIDFHFDDKRPRRFAGDPSLPRGCYYTIADTDGGEDHGTLLREMRSYYNPWAAGLLTVIDGTTIRDKAWFSEELDMSDKSSSKMLLYFLQNELIKNPFCQKQGISDGSLKYEAPIRVTKCKVRNVLDLRDPRSGAFLANILPDLKGLRDPVVCKHSRISQAWTPSNV